MTVQNFSLTRHKLGQFNAYRVYKIDDMEID